jgi:hypothetical protein
MDDYVDFSDIDTVLPIIKPTSLYKENYNDTTTEFYRVMRQRKINVITQDDDNFFNTNNAFMYNNMWDPYTGEITGIDPYGPLYFHPNDLIHYFYIKRLQGLWNEPLDEKDGYFAGYYGELLGTDLYIEGRGSYTDLYLFRLPIVDCYLQTNHDYSIITMGPILTDTDIKKIDTLASLYYKNDYVNNYKTKLPSLMEMKQLYEQAISSNPDTSTVELCYTNKKDIANRNAVDKLKLI